MINCNEWLKKIKWSIRLWATQTEHKRKKRSKKRCFSYSSRVSSLLALCTISSRVVVVAVTSSNLGISKDGIASLIFAAECNRWSGDNVTRSSLPQNSHLTDKHLVGDFVHSRAALLSKLLLPRIFWFCVFQEGKIIVSRIFCFAIGGKVISLMEVCLNRENWTNKHQIYLKFVIKI